MMDCTFWGGFWFYAGKTAFAFTVMGVLFVLLLAAILIFNRKS